MSFREPQADSRPDSLYPDGWTGRRPALAGGGRLPALPSNQNLPGTASPVTTQPRVAAARSNKTRSSTRSTSVFSLLLLALLAGGWWQRNEFWYTAERGAGYAFGIIGASLMALLLLYPLRKHWKLMQGVLPVRHWFRLHMMFGILGPLFILFHSNFRLGSLNSNVALFCMLLVAGSGIVGRYVYRQIHQGLYGEKIRFNDLSNAFNKGKTQRSEGNILIDAAMENRLASIEKLLSARGMSVWRGWRAGRQLGLLRRKSKRQLKSAIAEALAGHAPDTGRAHELRIAYASWTHSLDSLGKLARYSFFARLFSLWHVLHLPIFFMMLISAIAHVVVVHMY